jgi:rubrerythrin
MKERINALETALKNEKAEQDFYMKHAERTSNLFGKRLFEKLAREEAGHLEMIGKLHEKWKQSAKWPATIPLTVMGTEVKTLIRQIKKDAAAIPAGNDDDLKAVRTALDFEARGRDFYAALRDLSQDSKERAFFDLLSRTESDHFLSLKETEAFLVDPAAWYRKKDPSGWLDGGA